MTQGLIQSFEGLGPYAIEVKGVSKRYGDFAMENVSLSLPQGCVLGLVGENGAGKSTLIRMILGACRPDGGEIVTLGRRADSGAAFAQVREEIGVVLDEACLPQEMKAPQVGKMMAGVYQNWDMGAFEGYIRRFGVPMDKEIKTFSRGTKMKLAIAAAMSHGAKLLVLDEATGGLDPIVREEMLDLFNEFTRDETHAILLSSHIVTDLEKICDYIVFLHEGRVLMADEKDALEEKYAVAVLDEMGLASLREKAPGAILRVLRSRGMIRALVRRTEMRDDALLERASIEEIMLLLSGKGEKIR